MTLKPIFESLFFATDEPLNLKRLCEVLPETDADEMKTELEVWREGLAEDENRGLQLIEVAGGYLLATKPEHNEVVERLLERKKKRALSQAALETLAVIAYRQPVTRAEIEAVRGVNVDSMVHTLLQRRLIKLSGRKDVPGHPFLYRTTKHFLHHFGLRNLKELPRIDELTQALATAEEDAEEEPGSAVSENASPEEASGSDPQNETAEEPSPS